MHGKKEFVKLASDFRDVPDDDSRESYGDSRR